MNGDISLPGGENIGQNIAAIADFYDMKNLDIAGEDGDVVIETEYGAGYMLKEIVNNGAAVATVICQTVRSPTVDVTLKIGANGGRTGRLPAIYSITQTGTDDDLVLLLQKR